MTLSTPPKVELSDGVLGTLSLLRKASRDPSTAIPTQMLSTPFMSGRSIWKWHAVSGPDELEHVLATRGPNFPRSKIIHSVMGQAMQDSLFVADDETHQWQRRAVIKMYSTRRCRAHVPLFKDLVAREVSTLPNQEQFRFDAADLVENITLRASLKTACATYDPSDLTQLRSALDTFSDATLRVSPSDVFKLPFILSTRLKKRGAGQLKALKSDLHEQIKTRSDPASATFDDLLNCLLRAVDPATGQKMTEREVLGNLMMMVVAGHEPPASAISWAIYLLATHPKAQDRAREEALAAHEDIGGRADNGMAFLTAVIEEAMRLYPVVPILLRDTLKADQVGGCPVSAGSFMIVPIYAMHRSPVHWYEPDRFIPERFLSDVAPRRAFLPFSTGTRSCIGKTFAMVEMQTVLSEILTRFRFTPSPGKVPVPQTVMSLRPKGGVWIDAERL